MHHPAQSHITVPRHREHCGLNKQAHRLHTTPADVPEDTGSPGGDSEEEGALCQPSTESTVSRSPFFSAPRMCQSWCLFRLELPSPKLLLREAGLGSVFPVAEQLLTGPEVDI